MPIRSEPEWRVSDDLVAYETALAFMEKRIAAIRAGQAHEAIWLLEHPPLYTAGTSAKPEDLLGPSPLPVHATGRGGQYTYHGPGQRIVYLMLDLAKNGGDIRRFVCDLENWIIATLARFAIKGERRQDRIGIWVASEGREEKIAAIGLRVRRGIVYHGFAINRDPDLDNFAGIRPCGLSAQDYGVTSIAKLGQIVSSAELDMALRASFGEVFPDCAPRSA